VQEWRARRSVCHSARVIESRKSESAEYFLGLHCTNNVLLKNHANKRNLSFGSQICQLVTLLRTAGWVCNGRQTLSKEGEFRLARSLKSVSMQACELTLSRIVSGKARGRGTCGWEPAGVAWLVVMWSVLLDTAVPLFFRPQLVLSVILITHVSNYLNLRKSLVRMLRSAVLPNVNIDSKPLKP